jgi:hypothetical protein
MREILREVEVFLALDKKCNWIFNVEVDLG